MKKIFYSRDAIFELTDEEYQKAMEVWNLGQKCFIKRLEVSLSPLYIWAGKDPESSKDEPKILSDGTRAIKKFGEWFNELSGAKIDINYYPELKFKEPVKSIEQPSNFAKKLSVKM